MKEHVVFDPRGVVRVEQSPVAPRVRQLAGLRLGLLDNSKWNANKLLRGAAAAFSGGVGFAAVNYYVKQSFSREAAPELIDRIATENDIVLTAIGDCGSCTSACVRDAIALERRGVPTATVVTTEFVREMELTRRALGMDALRVAVIAHPVSSITPGEIEQRVVQIEREARSVWLGVEGVGGQLDANVQAAGAAPAGRGPRVEPLPI